MGRGAYRDACRDHLWPNTTYHSRTKLQGIQNNFREYAFDAFYADSAGSFGCWELGRGLPRGVSEGTTRIGVQGVERVFPEVFS